MPIRRSHLEVSAQLFLSFKFNRWSAPFCRQDELGERIAPPARKNF